MNWGNRLLVTFLVFGAGMTFLVYRSMHTNYELVDKEYYKSELRYQEVIDGVKRANALSDVVRFSKDAGGLALQFPVEMKNEVLSGQIHFYCDYDQSRDRVFDLKTDSDARQVLANGKLLPGNYLAKITWKAGGNDYYTEQPVNIN